MLALGLILKRSCSRAFGFATGMLSRRLTIMKSLKRCGNGVLLSGSQMIYACRSRQAASASPQRTL